MRIRRIENHIRETDITHLTNLNQGWTVLSKDCIAVEWNDGTETIFAIFQGPFTLEEMCRECDDYYEISTGGRIYHIDKHTLTILSLK